jgi:hypothetical protein
LGDENFVEEMEAMIDKDRDLSEVPLSQRRAKARALTEYETRYESLNKSILAAYKSGGVHDESNSGSLQFTLVECE